MQPLTIAYIGNFRPEHSTENHVAQALRHNGHRVIELQEDEPGTFERAGNLSADHGADLIWWTRTGWTPPVPHEDQRAMLAAARERKVPVIGFHLDRWWGLDRESQVGDEPFFECDMLFTADGGHAAEWERAGVRHVWAPPAVSLPETQRTARIKREYAVDVAFVGNWQRYHKEWPHRRELVQWLTNTYRRRFGAWPRGRGLRGEALAELYATVKLVVGDSCLAGGATRYWSDRIPETMGRGALLLHPYVEGLTEHFPSTWVSLCTWELGDWTALRRLIDYWTHPDHDQERRDMAAMCRAWVQEHHTYEKRVEQVLTSVDKEGLIVPLRDQVGRVTLAREDGVTGTFELREGRYDGIAVEETWSWNVYRLSAADVRGKVVVDIGANVGAFTVWAARAGAAMVHAYEPHPDIYPALMHNLELNGLGQDVVRTYQEAVGARSGHGFAVLGHSGYEGGSFVTGFDEAVSPDVNGKEVAATDLTTVLLRAGDGLVLKADCEGCEYDIFAPVDGGHLRRCDVMVMEFHGPRMQNSAHVTGGTSEFGSLVAVLAEEGHVETLGRPSVGGTIWWRRYGS